MEPAASRTTKRYDSVPSPWFKVAAVAVSVTVLSTWASFTGAIGTGAVAFSVEPSAAADTVGPAGVGDCDPHAVTHASTAATPAARNVGRDIECS